MKPHWLALCVLLIGLRGFPVAQTTVVLIADYDVAIGYHDNYNTANTNYNNAAQNAAYVVPGTSGGLNVNRALIHFDLSVIPPGAIITQALMHLYALGPPNYSISHTGSNNSTYLERITQPWGATTATWNNQPTSTTLNNVTLPASTSSTQDYLNIPVLPMVLDMMTSGNYGFKLRLVNEVLTNGLIFASLNSNIPSKFPRLEITYTLPLNPPPIHCLRVQPNGDVQLTWSKADTSLIPFHSYQLWYSLNPGGPFMQFDSIGNYTTTSTFHHGIMANTQPVWYYLTVRYGLTGQHLSPTSEIARPMILSVQNTNPASGIASLIWNKTQHPLLPSSTAKYNVWREYPSGNWGFRGSTSDTTHIDTILVCHDSVFYAVEIADTFQVSIPGAVFCTSRSSTNGDYFYKTSTPLPPVIDFVTVDTASNLVYVTWTPSISAETAGYLVFLFDGASYHLLDTIWGRQTTAWHDMFNNPCSDVLTYAIASIDTCGLVGAMSFIHNTILPELQQKHCEGEHTLQWNHYQNMLPSLGGYAVYFNENGGAYAPLGNYAPATLSSTHTNLLMGSSYCYYIEAYDISHQKTSRSCIKCNTIAMPQPIEILYIKTATVQNNDHILVTLYADRYIPAQEYRLYRSDDGITFTFLAQIPPSSVTDEIGYQDFTAQVHRQSYYYYVQAIDLCGDPVISSDTAKTIFLSVSQDTRKRHNHLYWNDYLGFDGHPTTYRLWRTIGDLPETMPAAVLTTGTQYYLDDALLVDNCDQKTSYVIEAVEGPGNQYGLNGGSWSNSVSANQESRLFVPSAFTPGRDIPANATFRPVGICLSPEGYELVIFNRFGQMIFISHEIHHGWDGKYKEQPAPEGVYAWRLSATNASGNQIKQNGTVTLIR